MNRRAIGYAALMTALLVVYMWLVGSRALVLLRSASPVAIAIGVAAMVIPVVTAWFLWQEWSQAHTVSQMYRKLDHEGGLVEDTLPRTGAGRVDKNAALEEFAPYADAVNADPQNWRPWFHLGWAYDAAGDRRRARTSLRKAALLFKAERSRQE